jgi:putative phosphoesterase
MMARYHDTMAGPRQRPSRRDGQGGQSVRVAILSDTHGVLDPDVAALVAACDQAVHAGDVGNAAVLAALKPRSGNVVAVRGNNDVAAKWPASDGEVLQRLPGEAMLDLPGGRLMVVHGHRAGSGPARHERLRRAYPTARAVVYGHSHRLVCDTERLPWVLNPGAAGRARTYGGASCLVLVVEPEGWRLEVHRFGR